MEERVRLLIEKHKDDKDLTSEKDYIQLGWDWSHADLRNWNLLGLRFSIYGHIADFTGVSFFNANLMDAVFSHARLATTDLTEANLEGTQFDGAYLSKANLSCAKAKGANFSGANLQNANLWRADLEQARLNNNAKLQNSFIFASNLKRAQLNGSNFTGADLGNANLEYANLSQANLRDAKMNFHTILNNARLYQTDFKNSQLKHVHFFLDVIIPEEKKNELREAKEIYLSLKNYFKDEGMYEVSSHYYYREMLMARKLKWNKIKIHRWNKKSIYKSCGTLCRLYWDWFGSKIMDLTTGYGEKPFRVIGWWAGIVGGFSLIYWLGNGIKNHPFADAYNPTFWQSLYFSIVSFTTLGYGDFSPKDGIFQFFASFEAFLGAFFMALFVFVFTRKMIR